MQITVEKLPQSQVKITVQLTEEQIQKFMEQSVKEISQSVNVPGFRKGSAPLAVLKKHVREGAIENHTIDIAIQDSYTKAVMQEKLHVISRPQIKVTVESPLQYEATVAVYPEVKVEGYEKVSIKPEEIKVEEKEIDEFLLNFQKQYATYNQVDRPAQKGDRMEIDFEGFDEGGASLERATSKNHPFILGEGTLLPDFEAAMYGLKKDEEKTFTMTFPKDYHYEPFREKNVTFKVKVHFVEEMILPELTPEFLKEKLEADLTLDQVRKNLHASFERDKRVQERQRQENALLEKIIECTTIELPPQLVEEEITDIVEEFVHDMEKRRITMDQYLEANNLKMEDFRERYRKEAEKRLTLRFALFKVYEQEKIEATDGEVNEEIELRLARYPENEREKARAMYGQEGTGRFRVQNSIKLAKLFEKYLPPNPLLQPMAQISSSTGETDQNSADNTANAKDSDAQEIHAKEEATSPTSEDSSSSSV